MMALIIAGIFLLAIFIGRFIHAGGTWDDSE